MKRAAWISTVFWTAVCLCLSSTAAARPTVTAVVNGASYEPLIAPGSVIAIFGNELALSTAVASQLPLPTSLAGVTVTVGGVEAPLYFVSPGQINAQAPFEIGGEIAPLVVATPDGQSLEYAVSLTPTAPGIFTVSANGAGAPLLFDAGFALKDTVGPGDYVTLYATGLGATDPPASSGRGGAASEPFNRALSPPEVFVGEHEAAVTYAGLAPGLCGVYQLNVVIPDDLASNRLFLVSQGRLSNITTVSIEGPPHVTGSGVRVSENRQVGDFREIRLMALAEVEVTLGQAPRLRVEADDNVIGLIATRVEDGVLEITARGTYTIREGVKIFAGASALNRVDVSTLGVVRAEGVRGDSFDVNLSGMGLVTATGSVNNVNVLVQRMGNANLFELTARNAHVVVEGMGTVQVNATESLFARVNGFGNVIYSGDPDRVDARVDGFGQIRPAGAGWF